MRTALINVEESGQKKEFEDLKKQKKGLQQCYMSAGEVFVIKGIGIKIYGILSYSSSYKAASLRNLKQ